MTSLTGEHGLQGLGRRVAGAMEPFQCRAAGFADDKTPIYADDKTHGIGGTWKVTDFAARSRISL